jgi:hypothetical protein
MSDARQYKGFQSMNYQMLPPDELMALILINPNPSLIEISTVLSDDQQDKLYGNLNRHRKSTRLSKRAKKSSQKAKKGNQIWN